MLSTHTKLSIVVTISILLISFMLILNQKIVSDIESMQLSGKSASPKASTKLSAKNTVRKVTAISSVSDEYPIEQESSTVFQKQGSGSVQGVLQPLPRRGRRGRGVQPADSHPGPVGAVL